MSRRRLVVVLAAVVLLAACSDDPDSTSESTAGGTVVTSDGPAVTEGTGVPATAATIPETVIEISIPPGSADAVGALDDVEGLECAAADGRWTASGDVVNPTDATATYRIYVSFLDATGETLALIESDVGDVASAGRGTWSAGFDSTAADVRCVLRVERFAA